MPTSSKPTKYYSELQEKHVAKELNGKKTPASGAAMFTAGDVVIPNTMIIECKTTTKDDIKSFSIKMDWLEQNEKERMDLMLPNSALALSFDPSGQNNYYLINEKLMKKLVDILRSE